MRKMILQCGVLALSLLAANVLAAVSPADAAKRRPPPGLFCVRGPDQAGL